MMLILLTIDIKRTKVVLACSILIVDLIVVCVISNLTGVFLVSIYHYILQLTTLLKNWYKFLINHCLTLGTNVRPIFP